MRSFKPAPIALFGMTFFLGVGALTAHAEAAGLPQLDITTFSPQVIWLVLSFIVLYVIMAKSALPRIGQILEERQHRISDNLKKAEQLKVDAEAAAEAYEKSLTDSRTKAQTLLRETRESAAEDAAKRQADLADRLGKEIAQAEARIADAKDNALADARTVAAEIASEVAGRLTGDTLDAKDAEKAIAAVVEEGK